MKNKKILSAILVTITALTCSSNIVSAEETTEASTEAVTEVTSEITTEIPTETTAPVTTNTTEETTSVTTRKILGLFDGFGASEWTGGEFKKTITFSSFYKYGDFLGLYRGTELVDSEYYTAEYDGEKNITFIFNEKFREKYGNGRHGFSLEFESASLRNMFGFVITDPAKQTQTESPKTGDNNAAILTAILGLSGITACIFKKRKDGLKL